VPLSGVDLLALDADPLADIHNIARVHLVFKGGTPNNQTPEEHANVGTHSLRDWDATAAYRSRSPATASGCSSAT
jgi:hypothetical protein